VAKRAGVLTRALGAIGLQRKSTIRQRSVYAAARVGRLTQDWVTSFLSADMSIRGDFRLLRDRARELERDNPIVARYLTMQEENIVGDVGMKLKALNTVSATDDTLDTVTNTAIEKAWTDWCNPETASVDGLLSMTDIASLAVRRWKGDGESLVRIWRGVSNKYGFALQVIDADLLDHTYFRAPSETQNEIRMGVERDKFGRPVQYWMYTQHPSDYFGGVRQRVAIPAADLIHLYKVERPGQTRGITAIAVGMSDLNHVGAYIEAEVVAARQGATSSFFVKQDKDSDPVDPDAGENLQMELEPGVGQRLGPGEDIVNYAPQHPNAVMPSFLKQMLRLFASAVNVAYSSLTGDLDSANYSSLRDGSLKERDAYKRDQVWLASHLYRRVYLEWLKMAALTGQVKLPVGKTERFAVHRWIARGWAWVDPEKDIRSAAMAVQAGFDTRTRICAANGTDFEENLKQLAHEKELADAAGVTLVDVFLTPLGGGKGAPDTSSETPGNGNPESGTDGPSDGTDNKPARGIARVAA